MGAPSLVDRMRQKKSLSEVLDKLDAQGCDPIDELATIAMDKNVDIDTRVKVLRDLAQYVHPKRRSIEVSNKDGEALIVRIKRFGDDDLAKSKMVEGAFDGEDKET